MVLDSLVKKKGEEDWILQEFVQNSEQKSSWHFIHDIDLKQKFDLAQKLKIYHSLQEKKNLEFSGTLLTNQILEKFLSQVQNSDQKSSWRKEEDIKVFALYVWKKSCLPSLQIYTLA